MERIRLSDLSRIKSERSFKLAVQLSRLLNVIRANQRQYLRIENIDDPANARDRLELILYHGAIIYESLKTLLGYSKDLKSLKAWSHNAEAVKRLQDEFNNNKSFTQRYLEPIRNKILFHYKIDVLDQILEKLPLPDDPIFAEAKSERTLDLAFILADELIINYIIEIIEEPLSDEEKWGFFEEKLLDISNDLSNFLYDIVLELLYGHYYIEEEKK